MLRIKKNDVVMVTSGKDRGKTGKVLLIYKSQSRALVEGVNLVKKHIRRTQQDQKGGIVSMERPLSLSNIMPFCKSCNRPARVSFNVASDKSKIRLCRKCKTPI